MRPLRPVLPLLLLLLLAGAAAPLAGQAGVRDSAGVRIVTSTAGSWPAGRGWRVAERPAWSVGVGADTRLVGVRRLRDGRVAVLTPQWLRLYDAAGRFTTLAAAGAGPDALQSPTWLGTGAGDSLLVWDVRASRLRVFGARGVARSVEAEQLGTFFPEVVGAFGDGSFVGTPGADALRLTSAPEGAARQMLAYLRFSARGEPLGGVGRFAGAEMLVQKRGTRTAWEPLPFGRRTLLAAAGERLYVGSTDRFQVSVYTPQGRLLRIVRGHRPARPVTPAHAAALSDALRRIAATPQRRQEVEQLFRRADLPATLPALESLQVDADGNLWVEEYDVPGPAPRRWSVFDPAGRLLGTVATPPGVRVAQIGRDFVLGTGDDGQVRLFRLERA